MTRTNQKVSKAALKKAARRHNNTLQWCWNYERMQATGFAYSMVPVLRELYTTEEEISRQCMRHMQFYNTHPTSSAVIAGAAIALEEDYQTETCDSLKVALMGPLAGIGDTIQAVLVRPIVFIIAASLAAEGNYLSLFVISIPFIALWAIRFPLFNFGYSRSVNVIADIHGETKLKKLQEMAQIVGLLVIGGFVPGMIDVTTPLSYTKTINDVEQVVEIQNTLDGILPFMLSILCVYFCYWLIKTKKVKPLSVILIIAVIGFVCGALGILA